MSGALVKAIMQGMDGYLPLRSVNTFLECFDKEFFASKKREVQILFSIRLPSEFEAMEEYMFFVELYWFLKKMNSVFHSHNPCTTAGGRSIQFDVKNEQERVWLDETIQSMKEEDEERFQDDLRVLDLFRKTRFEDGLIATGDDLWWKEEMWLQVMEEDINREVRISIPDIRIEEFAEFLEQQSGKSKVEDEEDEFVYQPQVERCIEWLAVELKDNSDEFSYLKHTQKDLKSRIGDVYIMINRKQFERKDYE